MLMHPFDDTVAGMFVMPSVNEEGKAIKNLDYCALICIFAQNHLNYYNYANKKRFRSISSEGNF